MNLGEKHCMLFVKSDFKQHRWHRASGTVAARRRAWAYHNRMAGNVEKKIVEIIVKSC
jgi:hypothetical protein